MIYAAITTIVPLNIVQWNFFITTATKLRVSVMQHVELVTAWLKHSAKLVISHVYYWLKLQVSFDTFL